MLIFNILCFLLLSLMEKIRYRLFRFFSYLYSDFQNQSNKNVNVRSTVYILLANNKLINKMSKVYSDLVKKAQVLAAGLKKNFEEVKNRGIEQVQIAKMETDAAEVDKLSKEIDDARLDLSLKIAQANRKTIELKAVIRSSKQAIKQFYDQEQWFRFGIPDKR